MSSTGLQSPLQPTVAIDERFCETMDAAPVMIRVFGVDQLCTWSKKLSRAFIPRAFEGDSHG